MLNLLQSEKIFTRPEIQNFIIELEKKYLIESAQEKYHNLVNFSTNTDVPYHQWFTYREGFAGSLITELISISNIQKGEFVIDPFCGSGTVNVVASLNGYKTFGLDVNPMSAFIADSKIEHYSEDDIKQVNQWLKQAQDQTEINIKPGYKDVEKYFSEQNFKELVRIKTFIDSLPESKAKKVMLVAYISIVIDCSDRKRDGNGLKKRVSKVKDVFHYFSCKVNLILKDIIDVPQNSTRAGSVVFDTAYNLSSRFAELAGNEKAGAIIFSPPYANSFDYFESYKLELVMGDYAAGMKGIGALRKRAVRSFIGGQQQETCDHIVDLIAKEIEEAIPAKEAEQGKPDQRTRKVPNMIRGYFSDMREVIRQCSLSLAPGKKTYIVVDQSAYLGKIVPTDLLLAYFGEKEGFEVGKIIVCRKARTSTQQLNKYPYLKTLLRESIVELVKL